MMYARECGRGHVIRVNLDPSVGREQAKTRPCVVVQTAILSRAQTTIVVPVSDDGIRGPIPPFIVPIGKGEGGLTKDSHILVHQIRVIDESRIMEKVGMVNPRTLVALDAALR